MNSEDLIRKGQEALEDVLTIWDKPVSMHDLLVKKPEPIQWLFDQRIQLGRGALVTGIGGSSKTRFLYHLAIGSVVGRLPWDWTVATTGKAVLVLTEDTEEDVHRTLYATCKGMNLSEIDIKRVEQSVVIYALAGKDVKLLAAGKDGGLVKTPHFEQLEERINSEGDVVFIGLDPALSLTTGEEGDQGHQRSLGKMVDDLAVRTGAASMLVSHAAKSSQQSDELSSHNSRGGGAITDAVRAEYALRTMTAQEAKKAGITDMEERKRHVQLAATKGNHLPPSTFVPVWLRRGEYGVLMGADISLEENTGPSPNDIAALDILKAMAKTSSPKLEDWRDNCIGEGILKQKSKDSQKKAMDRIVSRLKKAGLVESGFTRGVYQPVIDE